MKYHRMVNSEKEDVSIKCDFSDIYPSSFNAPYYFVDLNSMDRIINLYTTSIRRDIMNIPDNINYKPNIRYPKSSIVIHNGQVFVCMADDGSDKEPNMYGKDWIAVSNPTKDKCVGYQAYHLNLDIEDKYKPSLYGSYSLGDIDEILESGKFYQYFNDGDYITIFDAFNNKYTMRMNYREFILPPNRGTACTVDLISDELIPTIKFKINSVYGIEKDEFKNEEMLKGQPIWNFSIIGEKLESYGDNLSAALSLSIKEKYGFYRGYTRNGRINTNPYIDDKSSKFYLFENIQRDKPMYKIPHKLWIPTEREVFGTSYGAINPSAESGSKQFASLNTSHKRVKTLNGVPKPWATYTIHKNTKYPVIVNTDGTQLPLELYAANNISYNEDIYVPMCFTLGGVIK